jgi:hypothetical protein
MSEDDGDDDFGTSHAEHLGIPALLQLQRLRLLGV